MRSSIFFLFFLFFMNLNAQEVRYDGSLLKIDLTVKDVRIRLKKGENIPNLRFRFAYEKGIYLIFYDHTGEEIYYIFREDRFDRRKSPPLRKGQIYSLQGKFVGLLGTKAILKKENSVFLKELEKGKAKLLFQFQGVEGKFAEKILL